jgi:hypothetical protein
MRNRVMKLLPRFVGRWACGWWRRRFILSWMGFFCGFNVGGWLSVLQVAGFILADKEIMSF